MMKTRNNWKFTKKKARKQIKEIKRIMIEIEKNKKIIYLDQRMKLRKKLKTYKRVRDTNYKSKE